MLSFRYSEREMWVTLESMQSGSVPAATSTTARPSRVALSVPERAERLSSVAVAARMLQEFGRHSTQLGISQLARSLGIGKSSAHRIVWTLVAEGLLERVDSTGLFRLTTTMRYLGASAETAQRLHEAATMPLDRLRAHTNGTLHLAILEGADVIYVERREGPGSFEVFRAVGARVPAHTASTGKILLAMLPPAELEEVVATMRLARRTPRTITSRTALLAELAQARRHGYAESHGESQQGMYSVAAPVRDSLGRTVAAVSVAERVDDVDIGRPALIRPVVQTAARISAALKLDT